MFPRSNALPTIDRGYLTRDSTKDCAQRIPGALLEEPCIRREERMSLARREYLSPVVRPIAPGS